MYTEVIGDIIGGSKSHTIINSIEACYRICYCIKLIQMEWKVAILSTQNMGKVLHKLFKSVVNDIL